MNKILYIAPFVKSRYKGGIMKIAEFLGLKNSEKLFSDKNILVEFFNSHLLSQSKNSDAKFRLENFKQAFSFYVRLKKRMKTEDYSIIHINSSYGLPLLKDLIIVNILKGRTKKPILFQIHFSGIDETFSHINIVKKIQLYLLSKSNAIILLSNSFRDELISIGFDNEKIEVLYNFHPIIEKKGIVEIREIKKLNLLFMGSIDNRKGILDLLESLIKIPIEYELNVAGSFSTSEIEQKFNEHIKNNKLHVNFLGYVSGEIKDKLLQKSHILILPSYAEGFPMVIPEAMAYGCAILATRIAGIPEIVIENENGLLFEPGDKNCIRKALCYLFNNHEVLTKFMSNSLQNSKKFNLPTYIDNLSSIYNKYLQ